MGARSYGERHAAAKRENASVGRPRDRRAVRRWFRVDWRRNEIAHPPPDSSELRSAEFGAKGSPETSVERSEQRLEALDQLVGYCFAVGEFQFALRAADTCRRMCRIGHGKLSLAHATYNETGHIGAP